MATKNTENEVSTTNEVKTFDGNTKYWVKNLCNWTVGMPRQTSTGDISIPPNGKILVSDEEIRGQIFANNVLFVGENGDGSHARVYIEDKDLRIDLGIETKTEAQKIVDDKVIKSLLSENNLDEFKKQVEILIITDGEKATLIECARKQNLNDYQKIKFIEEHTDYKF